MTMAQRRGMRQRRLMAGRLSTGAVFALVLLAIGAVASVEVASVWRAHQATVEARLPPTAPAPAPSPPAAAQAPASPPAAAQAPTASPPVATSDIEGALDRPLSEAIVGPRIALTGWALTRAGPARVEARIGELRLPAVTGMSRLDVAAAKPGIAGNDRAGFELVADLSAHPAPDGVDRRELDVVAIAADGRERVLARRSVVEPAALSRWSFLHARGPQFHLLPALSGIPLNGAAELDDAYTPYLSSTMRTGMRVPILYLRTTKGPAGDYAFDPSFDIERRCGSKRVAEDNLGSTLAWSASHNLPVLLTLNGGVWADAACDVPAWDINDRLEQDAANCQWNEHDQVMPDDELKHLPGSQDAPELGRSLTFNVYATRVRHYKRRNLQQAGRMVAAFMRQHPDLVVGVNLDPDTYLNPFYNETQWYDYNPGTLRQFREWLSGTGPYAGQPRDGAPDLRAYRRARPLTLSQVSAIAGRTFARWQDVDPPRAFPRDPAHPFWKDPWVREWEHFRRHLVKLHYDELSEWLVAVGVPRDRIWSSQGLMAPLPGGTPFALHLDSPVKDADSGGMSVEGSLPRMGHLGVILYGASAVNDVPMENGRRLFTTLATMDPGFAVVEYNTADLRNPAGQPTYVAAYRGLRDLWNSGARFVSPMAWNGSNGLYAGQPGYVTYTAWRNTPLEDAAKDFLLARAGLPLGARLWTFGTPRHADGDGWVPEHGKGDLQPGQMRLSPADDGTLALVSPTDLALPRAQAQRLVLGLPHDAPVRTVDVWAQGGGRSEWRRLASAPASAMAHEAAGYVLPLPRASAASYDRLRIVITTTRREPLALTRIALLP